VIDNITHHETEMAVLGSLILDNQLIDKVSFLNESDFYDIRHKQIYRIITDLCDNGKSFDPVSIDAEIDSEVMESLGGYSYLVDLMKVESQVGAILSHADKLRDLANRREIVKASQHALQELLESKRPTNEIAIDLEKEIDKQLQSSAEAEVFTIEQMVDQSMSAMKRSSDVNYVSGVKTGLPEIDEMLGYKYMATGEITVLGGLSKNGKTLTANTITARCDLGENGSAHVFSIEMPAVGMFNSVVSAMSGVPSDYYDRQDFYHEMMGEDEYTKLMSKWGHAAHYLNESNRLTIDGQKEVDADYICANMKKQFAVHRNNGKRLRLVIIDHLHRMNFDAGNLALTYAIREAVRKIKNTASELGVSVLLLAQLKNEAQDKDPTSFHILDSSSVRHELQAFIGTRMYRDNGVTYFGFYADAQRYADMYTKHTPSFVYLQNGVMTSLPEGQTFTPPTKE